MKYFLSFVGVVAVVCGICFFREPSANTDEEYVRIHITANSNSQQDQNLKYLVKDVVLQYLTPILADVKTKDEAIEVVYQNLASIEDLVNQTLESENVNYCCHISLSQEEIPTRKYDDIVVKAGMYDSLKIDLGQAQGDNWWCLVFPTVCFVPSENFQNVEYISKIWEIINNVINQK